MLVEKDLIERDGSLSKLQLRYNLVQGIGLQVLYGLFVSNKSWSDGTRGFSVDQLKGNNFCQHFGRYSSRLQG